MMLSIMQDFHPGEEADPLEVERLVKEMMHALQVKDFRGVDGITAALTFSHRVAKVLLTLTPNAEAKVHNAKAIAAVLRELAAQLEFEYTTPGTIH